MDRYLKKHLLEDIRNKMVFVSGPRQCGKTTLVKSLQSEFKMPAYLNYDSPRDKKTILNQQWDTHSELVIFDEIHKYGRWKNWIKGIYDTRNEKNKFIVTGSARLDVYKRGQDSLLGRYHGWRLHPFCLAENPLDLTSRKAIERFIERGGFPEPYLDSSSTFALRWKNEHLKITLKEDVRDLTRIREISLLDLFFSILQQRVGSPVTISNLAQDVEIAPKTAKIWVGILEQLYLCIAVKPYAGGIDRGLVIPPKIYFYNNAEVEGDIGSKFENLVANHLLKRAHFLEDSTGDRYELRYIRDKEKREVDFIILKNRTLEVMIECKWADTSISQSLKYYSAKFPKVKALQLVGDFDGSFKKGSIQVMSAYKYLSRSIAEGF